MGPDETLEVRSWVIGASAKLLWIWHELWAGGRLRATEEVLGLHVDSGRVTGRAASTPFPADVAERVRRALVAPPAEASRSIAVR